MEKILLIIFYLLFYMGFSDISYAHDCGPLTNFLEGNGIIMTEKRNVAFFNEIEIRGAYKSTIASGKKQTIAITGDQNLLPHITTVVKDKKLLINNCKAFSTKNTLNLNITVPDIVKVTSNGSSQITINDVDNQTLSIVSAGAGEISVSGITKKFDVRLFGASELHAKDLQSEDVRISIEGACNAKVFADKVLDANIKGMGSIVYFGKPSEINKEMAGVGRLIEHH